MTDRRWIDERTVCVDGVEFVYSFSRPSTSERFSIRKPRDLVEDTIRLAEEFRQGRIVELGIAYGGGTALIALVAQPEVLIALDLNEERVDALDQLINDRSLQASIHPHYGVDQSDTERVASIIDSELGGAQLDLVVDDASHRYQPSGASFEVLFPRVRPGGAYVIEDWSWQTRIVHAAAHPVDIDRDRTDRVPPLGDELDATMRKRFGQYVRSNWSVPPLERLVLELVLARACRPDAVGDLTVGDHQVVVRRGDARLDPRAFRIGELHTPFPGLLA